MWGRAPREPALSEAEGSSRAQRGAVLPRMLALSYRSPNGFECHFRGSTIRPSLPLEKQSRIILRDVIRRGHAEFLRSRIDPPRRSFNLAEISDRRLVHDNLP